MKNIFQKMSLIEQLNEMIDRPEEMKSFILTPNLTKLCQLSAIEVIPKIISKVNSLTDEAVISVYSDIITVLIKENSKTFLICLLEQMDPEEISIATFRHRSQNFNFPNF